MEGRVDPHAGLLREAEAYWSGNSEQQQCCAVSQESTVHAHVTPLSTCSHLRALLLST